MNLLTVISYSRPVYLIKNSGFKYARLEIVTLLWYGGVPGI